MGIRGLAIQKLQLFARQSNLLSSHSLITMIQGILLAAGASRRFGADKLTQRLPDGEQVAVRACRNLLSSTDKVLAVVRPNSPVLTRQLQTLGAEVIVCVDSELGMGVSLAFAIRACPHANGWVIALADMPWIMPTTIEKVTNELRAGAKIVAPCWQGQRGHPVGFSKIFGSELAQLQGDSGAKSLLQTHIQQLKLIDCNDPGVLQDIDHPTDLSK